MVVDRGTSITAAGLLKPGQDNGDAGNDVFVATREFWRVDFWEIFRWNEAEICRYDVCYDIIR